MADTVQSNFPISQMQGGASTSDLLTAQKNLVSSVNNLSQTYIQINGAQVSANIENGASPTLVKSSSGRVVNVFVSTEGSTLGIIYDSNTASVPSNATILYKIPNTIGLYQVNMPAGLGIVVSPGTDQVVTVSYS